MAISALIYANLGYNAV